MKNSPQLPPYVKHNKTNDDNTDVEFKYFYSMVMMVMNF